MSKNKHRPLRWCCLVNFFGIKRKMKQFCSGSCSSAVKNKLQRNNNNKIFYISFFNLNFCSFTLSLFKDEFALIFELKKIDLTSRSQNKLVLFLIFTKIFSCLIRNFLIFLSIHVMYKHILHPLFLFNTSAYLFHTLHRI